MIRPIYIATDGYLDPASSGFNTLGIATRGYIAIFIEISEEGVVYLYSAFLTSLTLKSALLGEALFISLHKTEQEVKSDLFTLSTEFSTFDHDKELESELVILVSEYSGVELEAFIG
jgi:hypothetical protein